MPCKRAESGERRAGGRDRHHPHKSFRHSTVLEAQFICEPSVLRLRTLPRSNILYYSHPPHHVMDIRIQDICYEPLKIISVCLPHCLQCCRSGSPLPPRRTSRHPRVTHIQYGRCTNGDVIPYCLTTTTAKAATMIMISSTHRL